MVWTDDRYKVIAKSGSFAAHVPIGGDLFESFPVLMNLEDAVRDIRRTRGEAIDLANLALVRDDGTAERRNYQLRWDHDGTHVLLTITRPLAASDANVALQQQTRRTILAETQLAEQARAIRKANEALRKANADLQEFTRIISHDLTAPLRALRYFAEDLEGAIDDSEPSDAKVHIEGLKAQSRRMSSMVNGLLAYTRLERRSDGIEPVDTRALIDEIIASLPLPNDFAVHVEGRWPQIRTLRAPLDLTLRNLIDNAIKHHDDVVGMVKLTGTLDDGMFTVVIADDGPGIPEQYQDAVFRPFTSVAPEATDRTGMGLTLVKRAVETIGGELDLVSSPTKRRGTTFRLQWPTEIEAI